MNKTSGFPTAQELQDRKLQLSVIESTKAGRSELMYLGVRRESVYLSRMHGETLPPEPGEENTTTASHHKGHLFLMTDK